MHTLPTVMMFLQIQQLSMLMPMLKTVQGVSYIAAFAYWMEPLLSNVVMAAELTEAPTRETLQLLAERSQSRQILQQGRFSTAIVLSSGPFL